MITASMLYGISRALAPAAGWIADQVSRLGFGVAGVASKPLA